MSTKKPAFSEEERALLLALKGVGPVVIQRLEQMGFSSLAELSKANPQDILAQGAALTGSSCWKNSPQSQNAIQAAINLARLLKEKQP